MSRFVSKPYVARVWVPARRMQIVIDARNALIRVAGGLTETSAWGSWTDAKGNIHSEPVTIFEVVYGPENILVSDTVKRIVDWLLEAGEHEVLVAFKDGARVYS